MSALQVETNIPPLHTRIHATHCAHLTKLLRRDKNATTQERLRQALLQDTSLFKKRTWASKVAEGIKHLDAQQLFLQLKPDPAHDAYRIAPPWQQTPLKFTTHKLTQAKSKLGAAELTLEAREALQSALMQGADVYYTDGSVDTYSGNAAAAFIHKEDTAHFRLPDGSSTLQT